MLNIFGRIMILTVLCYLLFRFLMSTLFKTFWLFFFQQEKERENITRFIHRMIKMSIVLILLLSHDTWIWSTTKKHDRNVFYFGRRKKSSFCMVLVAASNVSTDMIDRLPPNESKVCSEKDLVCTHSFRDTENYFSSSCFFRLCLNNLLIKLH